MTRNDANIRDSVKASGIVGGVAFRVRITGYRTRPNDHIPPGTTGLLEPCELSVDGEVIHGVFYPDGSDGHGGVTWPLFESCPAPEPE